jgi:hypothetical protein
VTLENGLVGAGMFVLGTVLVWRRKDVAARTVREQNAFWRTSFGERQIRVGQKVSVIVGLAFIAFAFVFWLS